MKRKPVRTKRFTVLDPQVTRPAALAPEVSKAEVAAEELQMAKTLVNASHG